MGYPPNRTYTVFASVHYRGVDHTFECLGVQGGRAQTFNVHGASTNKALGRRPWSQLVPLIQDSLGEAYPDLPIDPFTLYVVGEDLENHG